MSKSAFEGLFYQSKTKLLAIKKPILLNRFNKKLKQNSKL